MFAVDPSMRGRSASIVINGGADAEARSARRRCWTAGTDAADGLDLAGEVTAVGPTQPARAASKEGGGDQASLHWVRLLSCVKRP
ncbi:MAG: hypothetical protein U0R79_07470 [Propionicimonas sp.]